MNLAVAEPLDTQSALDVVRALAPARRAMGFGRVVHGIAVGFAVGGAIATILLLAGHIWSWSFALPAGLSAAALGIVAGTAAGLIRWPQPLETARAVDLHFDLNDRLTTALELRSSLAPVAVLQRRDTADRLSGLPLRESRGRWLERRELAAAGVVALVLAGALALGPPSRAHHAGSNAPASSQRQRRAAANHVKQLTAKLQQGLTPSQLQTPSMRQLNRALTRLRSQLVHASSQRQALRSISATQQQLHRIALGLHPVNSKAVAQLNTSLGKYLNKSQAAKQRSSQSAAATAKALNTLARSLSHLTPSQRAALARALARAANATSNNQLRTSLRQGASSLASGDPQSASNALRQAAQALARSPGQQAALSRLSQAGSQLSSVKNQLSGSVGSIPQGGPSLPNGSRAGQQPGQGKGTKPGQGQAPGNGRTPGKGQAAGQGQVPGKGQRGTRGQGAGTGRGTRTGTRNGNGQANGRAGGLRGGRGAAQGQNGANRQGTATGTGKGVAGAHGAGGKGRAGGSKQGHNATVFIPAQQSKGKNIVQNGPNGAPEPGAVVPYQQVVGQYTQSAHQALDRSALPPSLQGYVRRYFTSISH